MTTNTDAPRRPARVLGFAVAILFGLLYAYDLFEAVSNLVAVPGQLAEYNEFLVANGLEPVSVPWLILVANLVLPLIVFAVASWIGRRQRTSIRALLYLAGLAVVAAITLSFTALV